MTTTSLSDKRLLSDDLEDRSEFLPSPERKREFHRARSPSKSFYVKDAEAASFPLMASNSRSWGTHNPNDSAAASRSGELSDRRTQRLQDDGNPSPGIRLSEHAPILNGKCKRTPLAERLGHKIPVFLTVQTEQSFDPCWSLKYIERQIECSRVFFCLDHPAYDLCIPSFAP